jgi:hypothetical protein
VTTNLGHEAEEMGKEGQDAQIPMVMDDDMVEKARLPQWIKSSLAVLAMAM